jgi:endoglycosylceramidase
VFLHGVNAVYKLDPYELFPDPAKAWNFSAADAARMAALGFNVVRLGITWQGLEPGNKGPNDRSICSTGMPRDPHQYEQKNVDAYLQRLDKTVAILSKYGIYSLIDMHQDLYGAALGGDGAPDWAVCTGIAHGSVFNKYLNPAVAVAFNHFWNNDVVGGLQNEYDRVSAAVASHFAANRSVVGYDVFNEPFSAELALELFPGGERGQEAAANFDGLLECFYTGTAHIGTQNGTHQPVVCPAGDPSEGAVARILRADPNHLTHFL